MKITRASICLFTGLALALLSASAAISTTSAKPNIIFILADDYGIGEVSCYGADHYKTPNIDQLAQEGTRFTNAYTVSLCGPSRAMILSGRYPFRTGASNQDAVGRLKPETMTLLPTVLKSAGYVTAAIGKWSQFPLSPAAFGFDDYLQFQGSGIYWNTQAKGKSYELNGQAITLQDKQYLPDLMHDHLVDFITQNRDKPFYVHYALSHVHNEILPTPDSTAGSKDIYADNVAYMDKLVGKLMAALDRLQLRERTLVVFLGDNGTANVRSDRATIGGRRLDGAKGSMRDGGGRVPMIARWPGVTPAAQVSAQMIDASDFLPTFTELAGAPLPAKTKIDGHSIAAQLRGEPGQSRAWIFNQLARNWYVREANWKLNQSGELLDMSDAPFAEKLVSANSNDPAAVAARSRLQAALDELNPAGGIMDDGDPSGRHAKNVENAKKNKEEE